MSRVGAPSIPFDLNSRSILVEDFESRLPRCECCPVGVCVSCADETRALRTFRDRVRVFSPGGALQDDSGFDGDWLPVACEDRQSALVVYPTLVEGIPRPNAGWVGPEDFGLGINDRCLIPQRTLPPAGAFPLTACRVYYWENPLQVDESAGLPGSPVWIAAIEIVSGDEAVVGWLVAQQFVFRNLITSPIWAFTPDGAWPFNPSPIALWGCGGGATPADDVLRIDLV